MHFCNFLQKKSVVMDISGVSVRKTKLYPLRNVFTHFLNFFYFVNSSMSESKNENKEFPHIPFSGSGSFHSTEEGKVWTRLLINLCWWLHDMYELDSENPDEKFRYIEQQINDCHALFPAKFTLMFSDPNFSSNDQHPLLLCRQEEHKIIILVFRATVSSKSIQDVFTDASIYSNHQIYLGSRHSGFAQRVETAPLLAVTNWLRSGWKIIITGHSLGGAVSQLFTAQVISKLVEAGVSLDMISLHCVTFGTPQCADHHFWSSYTEWYDVFDSYVYGNDAIFRLATFGADITKKVIDSFVGYLQKLGIKLCAEMFGYNNENLTNSLIGNCDQIRNISLDVLVPTYSIFGRHHFIRRNEKNQLQIDSIGESEDEKNRLLADLRDGHCWYNYFVEKKMIPGQFTFMSREFMEHGCYPFSINQLFNREIKLCLDKKFQIKQKLFRIGTNDGRQIKNQASDISALINFPDGISLCYIYFQGFFADFIISVTLPVELAESENLREKKPTVSLDQPDAYAILCFQSDASIKYLQTHSCFEVKVKTYFGYINVQVAVLSNFNSKRPSVYQLDPIQTVLRAYNEFILDTTSIEQIDSPLSRSFSLFFGAYKHIGQNEFDIIMARYWAEAEARNFFSDITNHIQAFQIPETKEAATTYFNELLKSLSERANIAENDSEEKRNASFLHTALKREVSGTYSILPSSLNNQDEASVENLELIPLYLDFGKLRQCLYELHNHDELSIIERNLKAMRAPYLFTLMKLKQLPSVKHYTLMDKTFQSVRIYFSKKCSTLAGLMGIGGVGATAAVGTAAAGATGAAAAAAAGAAAVGAAGTAAVGAAGAAAVGAAGAAATGAAGTAVVVGTVGAAAATIPFLPILFALAMTGPTGAALVSLLPIAIIGLGPVEAAVVLGQIFAPAEVAAILGALFGSAAVGAAGAAAAGAAGAAAAGAAGAAAAGVAGVAAAGVAGTAAAGAAGVAAAGAAGTAAAGVAGLTAMIPIVGPVVAAAGAAGTAYSLWRAVSERQQVFGDYRKIMKPFTEVVAMVLVSTESVDGIDENENVWQILDRIASCHWLQKLTQVKSTEERDIIWTQTFTKYPLKDISHDDRWYIVSVTQICCQLIAMRQILARQPPKVIITGQSQTGKSTLFQYFTKRNMEQLRSNTNFNTRMSLQCPAFIEPHEKSSNDRITGDPGLPINIIDNPGYDDATGQAHILLNLSLASANLVILVTTLQNINQLGTIDQLDKILHDTHVNVLVLINQVDLRLKEASKKKKSYYNDDSDEDSTSSDELNEEFSLRETLVELLKRPIEELIQKLTVDSSVIKERVTFQPVILNGFNDFMKTFKEPSFRNDVHKSNINKWIKKNLLNYID
jgi:GTP-binding protein EngB required for normal cell division